MEPNDMHRLASNRNSLNKARAEIERASREDQRKSSANGQSKKTETKPAAGASGSPSGLSNGWTKVGGGTMKTSETPTAKANGVAGTGSSGGGKDGAKPEGLLLIGTLVRKSEFNFDYMVRGLRRDITGTHCYLLLNGQEQFEQPIATVHADWYVKHQGELLKASVYLEKHQEESKGIIARGFALFMNYANEPKGRFQMEVENHRLYLENLNQPKTPPPTPPVTKPAPKPAASKAASKPAVSNSTASKVPATPKSTVPKSEPKPAPKPEPRIASGPTAAAKDDFFHVSKVYAFPDGWKGPQDPITYLENGAEILVCPDHGLEHCGRCFCDYTDMNREARSYANMRRHLVLDDGKSLGRGLLVTGTTVRMMDESGSGNHLDGEIRGVAKELDEESDFYGERCYVIQLKKDDFMLYPIEWLHEEWLVKGADGKYVTAEEYIERLPKPAAVKKEAPAVVKPALVAKGAPAVTPTPAEQPKRPPVKEAVAEEIPSVERAAKAQTNEGGGEADLAAAIKKCTIHEDGVVLGDGLLPTGTPVRKIERGGGPHLDATIRGVLRAEDLDSRKAAKRCYILQTDKNDPLVFPIAWLHEEWMVRTPDGYEKPVEWMVAQAWRAGPATSELEGAYDMRTNLKGGSRLGPNLLVVGTEVRMAIEARKKKPPIMTIKGLTTDATRRRCYIVQRGDGPWSVPVETMHAEWFVRCNYEFVKVDAYLAFMAVHAVIE